MKKRNLMVCVFVFPILAASSLAYADSAASDQSPESADPIHETSMTSDPSNTDNLNPNSNLYRANRSQKMNRHTQRGSPGCATTDLHCMHQLKTGPGQDSYNY